MRDYIIVSDSSTDFPVKIAHEFNIPIVPLSFIIDGIDYMNDLEDSSLSIKGFYKLLRQGKISTTSQVTSFQFTQQFQKHLSEGVDVLYIGFSSQLSGTFMQAEKAAEALRPNFPERKIVLIDTLSASLGEGLLVYIAAQQKKMGKSIEDVANYIEKIKLNIAQWFTVDDLNHLKRGGRVSATAAFMGTILNIKPVLHIDNNGKLVPVHKARGRKKSIEHLFDILEKTAIDPAEQTIFISHGDCLDEANILADMIRKRFNPVDIIINTIGPVVGSHAGPGTIALFFMAKQR